MMPDDFTDEEKKWITDFQKACLNGEQFTEHGPTPRAQQYIVDKFKKMGY